MQGGRANHRSCGRHFSATPKSAWGNRGATGDLLASARGGHGPQAPRGTRSRVFWGVGYQIKHNRLISLQSRIRAESLIIDAECGRCHNCSAEEEGGKLHTEYRVRPRAEREWREVDGHQTPLPVRLRPSAQRAEKTGPLGTVFRLLRCSTVWGGISTALGHSLPSPISTIRLSYSIALAVRKFFPRCPAGCG